MFVLRIATQSCACWGAW